MEFYLQNEYIENAELIFNTKNGKKVPVILNLTNVRGESDKLLYKRAVWRDISNLVEANSQIKKINIELLAQKQ